MANMKDQSRINWKVPEGPTSLEYVQAGAMQRIADAVEKMGENYTYLQQSRDWYKSRCEAKVRENEKLRRQVNAYKGMLKKKPKLQKQ